MSDFLLWRIFCGGTWERSRSLGWYRHDRKGSVPPGIIDSEDHRQDCWPVRLMVALSVVAFAVILLGVL